MLTKKYILSIDDGMSTITVHFLGLKVKLLYLI